MLKKSNYLLPEVAEKLLEDAQVSFRANNTFTPEILESLASVYGDKVVKAMDFLDKYQFTKYTIKDGFRSVYMLSSTTFQQLLFEQINYCSCESFSTEVFTLHSPPKSFSCEHVLALRLARITGIVKCEVVTNAQMTQLLNNQISTVFS